MSTPDERLARDLNCGAVGDDTGDIVCTLPPHDRQTRHEDERYGTTWRVLGE
jgi:hypothetical protein